MKKKIVLVAAVFAVAAAFVSAESQLYQKAMTPHQQHNQQVAAHLIAQTHLHTFSVK